MRTLSICPLLIAFAVLAADRPATPLAVGQPLRITIDPREVAAYSISMQPGEFAEIRILQEGPDVRMGIRDPDGKDLAEIEGIDGGRSEESVLLLAERSGLYLLDVAASRMLDRGIYQVTLTAQRPATAADRNRYRAQLLVSEAKIAYWEQREATARVQGIAKLSQAVDLFRGAGDELNVLKTLMHWIVFARSGDEYPEVVRLATQSIALARKLGNRGAEAQGLSQRGASLVILGEGRQGLDQAKESLAIWDSLDSDIGRAFQLSQLSGLYLHVGDKVHALEYLDQAVVLSKRTGENNFYNSALLSKAGLLLDTGKPKEALPLLAEAQPYYERIKDRSNQAFIQMRFGRALGQLGEKEKAVEHLERARALHADSSPAVQARTLSELADRFHELGQTDRAIQLLAEALTLRRQMGDVGSEASLLGRLAMIERDRGNLRAARDKIAAATQMMDSQRGRLGSTRLRAANLDSLYGAYNLHIEILRRLQEKEPESGPWLEQSFAIAENLRARGWMDTLATAKVNLREGVDPALLAEESDLRKQIDAAAADQRRLLATRAKAEQMDAAARQFQTLASRFDELEGRLRVSSPRLAELTQAQPVTLAGLRALLDADTALVEFFVGKNQSYVWVVTKESAAITALGQGGEIDELAGKLYPLLAARNDVVAKETTEQRAKRLAGADAALPEALARLSAKLLDPVAGKLAAAKRWLVVPDGSLHSIPIGALPGAAGHEVTYLPSATALAAIRTQAAARQAPGKLIALVADPVFDATDPRVTGKAAAAAPLDPEVFRRALEPFGVAGSDGRIPRLLFTRREVEAIAAAAPSPASKVTDFAASRQAALSPELAQHRIIHFATHGLLNNQNPELSGLLLSLVDEKGKPKDGFLQLRDIYSLHLPADLIVMSACQTALGKELRGEGVVGLTRGMMFAGASRVVSSLWKVDDSATAELMKLFYSAMWSDKLAPSAALHAAQVKLASQRRWQAPYYWAGFVLQGEYR